MGITQLVLAHAADDSIPCMRGGDTALVLWDFLLVWRSYLFIDLKMNNIIFDIVVNVQIVVN